MQRVERQFYANGTLREEAHYIGTLEHGAWRTWHPNGVLATEHWFDHGRYVNCVNRTWDELGQLRGECVWANGALIEHRTYDSSGALVNDALIAKKARAAERAARKTQRRRRPAGAPIVESHEDLDVVSQLLNGGTRDALEWLGTSKEPNSRSIGLLSQEQSTTLVHHLRSLGAARVLVAAVQRTPGTASESTNHVLVELPLGDSGRRALFLFERKHAEAHGYTPDFDNGSQYMYLKFA